MRNVYEVLKEKGITLPQPPAKGGVYTPVQELGEKFLYCSGCGPDLGNGNTVVGKLGKDLTVEDGQKAAYNCVLNLLANLNEKTCLLYTSPSPRDRQKSRMPSSA